MAKIIKVGSQNPTFTSHKAKQAGSIHTHRNSNEATNPFKFTNFEGNTLQFADVFEGFKPSFKSNTANKLRIVASSVTGSMNKMKNGITEPIANFVKRVHSVISGAWDYASSTTFTAAMSDASSSLRNVVSGAADAIKANPSIKQVNDILNTPIPMPKLGLNLDGLKERIHVDRLAAVTPSIDLGKGISEKWNGLVSRISFHGKQKYAHMSVAELETHLATALAEGGSNE